MPILNVPTTGDETYLDYYIPDTNFSSENYLRISSLRIAYIRMASYSLPTGSVINQVKLRMYCYSSTGSAPAIIVDRLGDLRNFATATWNNPGGSRSEKILEGISFSRPGWAEFDISNVARNWADGVYPNYGLKLYHDGYEGNFSGQFRTSRYSDSSYHPYFAVDYTAPPTRPSSISPNGGQSWTGVQTISWTAATDLDLPSNQLRYQVQLTLDNGQTWKDIVALTNAGVTSVQHDFSLEPGTSQARVRVRAYNGTLWSDWRQSAGVFTISHNSAPTAPTQLSPNGNTVNRANVVRLSWRFNDSDAGDTQSRFELRWRVQGTSTWNNVSQNTSNTYWDAPANTFNGSIEWDVLTYDSKGEVSPRSSQAVFVAGDVPDAPSITSPTPGEYGLSEVTTVWTSTGQTAFRHRLLQGALVIWDSGIVASTNTAQTVGVALENNTTYTIEVSIRNAAGLWSDPNTVELIISYTPPERPLVNLTPEDGYIHIEITNPEPGEEVPDVARNEIWRKDNGGEWVRLCSDCGTEYRDYTVASGTLYRYMVRAVGDNDTVTDSVEKLESATLRGVWLHDVADPSGTAHNFLYDGQGRSEHWSGQAAFRQYVGRTYQSVDWDLTEQHEINLHPQLWKRTDDYEALMALVRRKGTICYRDGKGRKMFGVIPTVSVDDVLGFGAHSSLSVVRIDHTEGV
jgi:hypothetical protein